MALSDLQVTVGDVVENIPLDASEVSATSTPVSTTDIEGWIQDATSDLSNALKRSGTTFDSLDDDGKRQLQAAVEAYAVAEALDATGFLSDRMRKYRQKWERLRERYTANPQSVNPSHAHFRSTVKDTDKRDSGGTDFTDPDYEF